MIRRDHEKGGFPVNRLRPILCYTSEGKLFIAYDNFTLKATFEKHSIVKCVGAWPGKRDTDIFVLDPQHYKDIPAPPAEYKNIDHATHIIVYLNSEGNFEEVVWVDIDKGEMSTDAPELYEYVVKAGRPHEVKTRA